MKQLVFIFIAFASFKVYSQIAPGRIEPCKIFGKIFIVTDKRQADYKIYEEETEAFAQLVVFKQENRFYADKQGQWFFTKDKTEADFWVYFVDSKGLSDFTIAYTQTESFAGCK